jgi:hypothetical protein
MCGADRTMLIDKLKKLTLSQQYALVDWLVELKGGKSTEAEDGE